jgi:hypothetical protein
LTEDSSSAIRATLWSSCASFIAIFCDADSFVAAMVASAAASSAAAASPAAAFSASKASD